MIRSIIREIEHPGTGKTQTRRILKPQPELTPTGLWHIRNAGGGCFVNSESEVGAAAVDYQPYEPGQLLWVREKWTVAGDGVWTIADARRQIANQRTIYAATASGADAEGAWWPSIHMPREFSRITLEVTAVKVERLQDISEEDAKAEGAERPILPHWANLPYKSGFRGIWLDIHGPASWDANPWVTAITFVPHLRNIDQLIAARAA